MPRPVRPWFRLYTEAFSDRKIRRLTPTQRWLWVAILGAARESPEPGVLLIAEDVPMTHAELAAFADVKEREVKPALKVMAALGMVTDAEPIVVCNFGSRQYESDNVTGRTREHRERERVKREGLERSYERSNDVPGNVRRNTPETETEEETEKDLSSEVAEAPSDQKRDDVERLCQHLADRIEQNGSKRPTVTAAWRRSCRLLLDRDSRTEDQVRRAIDWCQDDPFWMTNILGMPKLREKYDQLRLKASEQQRPALKSVPDREHFTPPPAPDDIPSRLVVQWNLAWSRANREGRPGPADWHDLEAS